MSDIKKRLAEVFDERQAEVLAELLADAHWRELVKTSDFNELKDIVKALAEAQTRTEERLGRLESAVERLAAAQARTEERIGKLEAAMERLAEAQARTEERLGGLETRMDRVEAALERLAEAQARTEERVGRLEERMDRVEAALQRLAEAQARTEERLDRLEAAVEETNRAVGKLAGAIDELRKQVGGLSETVGGDIEDIAYIVLHDVLRREYGWQVGVLERSWQTWNGEPEEVNVFGRATDPSQPDKTIWVVGEAKHNLTINEVRKFIRQVERAREHLAGEVFAVCFCYRARPEVQQLIQDVGLRLVFSYGKLV